MLLGGQEALAREAQTGYEEEKEGYNKDSYAFATSSNNTASVVICEDLPEAPPPPPLFCGKKAWPVLVRAYWYMRT